MNNKQQAYQPKTGHKCGCRRGIERDNCPACEGTGWQIDFAAIRRRVASEMDRAPFTDCEPLGSGEVVS